MKILLCASLFTISLVFLPASAVAQTATCQLPLAWNLQELVGEADYIFRALVRKAELTTANRPPAASTEPPWVKVSYELIESVKGEPPATGTLWTTFFEESECGGFPVLVGQDYLFMVLKLNDRVVNENRDDAIGYLRLLGSQMLRRIEPSADAPLLDSIRALAAR